MLIITFICHLLAFACFLAAAFWGSGAPRVNLVAAGLAVWMLSLLLTRV